MVAGGFPLVAGGSGGFFPEVFSRFQCGLFRGGSGWFRRLQCGGSRCPGVRSGCSELQDLGPNKCPMGFGNGSTSKPFYPQDEYIKWEVLIFPSKSTEFQWCSQPRLGFCLLLLEIFATSSNFTTRWGPGSFWNTTKEPPIRIILERR